ncbi:MAG: hypothetical protein IKM85_04520 [Bacteroidales bacterium]|nr:hypothetical protein [Bacteroidales bacterium]
MMNSNINYELEFLFGRWYERMEKTNGEKTCFTKDGILYKNELSDDEVLKKWNDSSKRVMFLLKDQNQEGKEKWDEDIRYWLKDAEWDKLKAKETKEKNRNLDNKFFKNLAYLFWGLSKATADDDNAWWYNEVTMHIEEVKAFFNSQPFALVECKKQPGGGYLDNKVLVEHLNNYKDLLEREIEIMRPNMIVCTNHHIYGTVLNMNLFPKKEVVSVKEHQPVSFHIPTGTLIFCSYHPSDRKSPNEIYEGVMDHYRAFLKSIYNL